MKFKLVLLSIAITILIVLGILNSLEAELKIYKGISFEELHSTCNTGDILLFRWNDIDLGFRIFSKFSHVGMIYKKKNGKVYVLETHPEGETSNFGVDTSGVHLHNIKKRIRHYNGTVYYAKLNLRDDPAKSSANPAKSSADPAKSSADPAKPTFNFIEKYIKHNLKRYKTIPFDDNFRNEFLKSFMWHLLGMYKPIRKESMSLTALSQTPMYCSEFIVNILDDICLLDVEKIPPVSPGSFEFFKHKWGDPMFEKLYRIYK